MLYAGGGPPPVLGGSTYAASSLTHLKNSSDKSVFFRHGDIKSHVSFELKCIRDMNNVLNFFSEDEHEEYLYSINEDTVGNICKFHNIAKSQFMQRMGTSVPANQKGGSV